MASIKYHLLTQSSKLADIPIETGNLIFDKEQHIIYMDSSDGERVAYQQIITLQNNEQRKSLKSPIHGAFYFVVEDVVLWQYGDDDEWHSVSSAPQIVFDSIDNFPIIGDTNRLYVAQNQIYRYYAGSYHLCANDSVWETI